MTIVEFGGYGLERFVAPITHSDEARPPSIEQPIRVEGAGRLEHGKSQTFAFQRGRLPEEGFVLAWEGGFYAFANSCPHWSVDLDYGMNDFYDASLQRIVCKNHGALFHPKTGFCEWGPCTGHSLERFELETEGADVVVSIPVVP